MGLIDPKTMQELAPYSSLGIQLAITIGLFALLGWWLDGKYDTKPVFTLICSLSGIAIGFYSFFKTISDLDKKRELREAKDKERKKNK
jgi:ATP synthase protein I